MIKKTGILLLATGLMLIVVLLFRHSQPAETIRIQTQPAEIGAIRNTVTATGTLQPINKIEVGTQVSGVIKQLKVDYNSVVKKGDLLAVLDKTLLQLQVDQSSAAKNSAAIEKDHLEKNYIRINALFKKGLVSQEEFDNAEYSFNQAKIALEKSVTEQQRALSNLSYTNIYSPIDGIVLSRAVDEGQTVAASLNAPTLFTIAKDLTNMEVQANVDEADIGQIKNDQRVEFTVDAFPDKSFTGKVSQVRLEPTVTSNVVTYTIIVTAENPELLLLPGMTASITVFTEEVENVITIPSKALRFKPDRELLHTYALQHGFTDEMQKHGRDSGRKNDTLRDLSRSKSFKEEFSKQPRVWILDNEKIKPVKITTGISDGSLIEVKEGLTTGTKVILKIEQQSSNQKKHPTTSESTNPFMPPHPSQRSRNAPPPAPGGP